MHLQLAFNLAHGIERNADHDEDGSTAERLDKRVAGKVEDNGRHAMKMPPGSVTRCSTFLM